MEEIIKTLYPMNRCLLGEGIDNALEFINHLIPLEIIPIPSGTKLGTWTVPDEWIIRDAWVKNENGEKIIDYKKQPLSLVVGSVPIQTFISLEELKKHLYSNEERPHATPYVFKFYDKDWGFCLPFSQFKEQNHEPIAGIKLEDGKEFVPKFKDKLKDERYEVFIDSDYQPGFLKIGVHTIKGKLDREILLFAHIDHPFQANDNLSGVACLVDLATKIKSDYTIKIVFCPETIGSIAYALTQDLSRVEFMLAVDICGNDGQILMQKSFKEHRINQVTHLALHSLGQTYNKGPFRATIGSDEYVFNDPLIDIPGIMLSRHPYPEYHTSDDTPEKIDYKKIEEIEKVILKIIEIYEKDYVPVRKFRGQLMRSKYGIQSPNPQVNLSWDYLIYNINGKNSLATLLADYGLSWDYAYQIFEKMKTNGDIGTNAGKRKIKKVAR